MNHICSKGFTFIEVLLTIALVMIISVPALTFYARFTYQMAVDDATEGLIGMFQEAQASAMSGKNNCFWGVKYESSRLVMFCGNSYADRNPALDQILKINPNVYINGFNEVVFESPSGNPNVILPDVTISLSNIEENISINSEGVVE